MTDARASLTQPNRTCNGCEFVGPIQYARDERRCDFLSHRPAPEWITAWLNNTPRPTPNYGPNTRADECGAFEPSTQDQP